MPQHSHPARLALEPTQPPVHLGTGSPSQGKSGQSAAVITHSPSGPSWPITG